LKAKGSSFRQETPLTLRNPKVQYRVNKNPATCPNPEPDQSSPRPAILFLDDMLVWKVIAFYAKNRMKPISTASNLSG